MALQFWVFCDKIDEMNLSRRRAKYWRPATSILSTDSLLVLYQFLINPLSDNADSKQHEFLAACLWKNP